MADLIPDEAVQPLATFLWGKDLQPEYPAGAEAHAVARALLAKCAPHILAAELERLIADPDNYTAGGAFRPIVLVHRRAELRSTTEGDTTHG